MLCPLEITSYRDGKLGYQVNGDYCSYSLNTSRGFRHKMVFYNHTITVITSNKLG